MASSINKTLRVTNSAIKLFNTIKPYHTHVLDVVEQYQFEERVDVDVQDRMVLTVTYRPKPDCDGEGWGSYYDNTFCGYSSGKCCEPFSCSGSFGLVWDNTNLFAAYDVVSVNELTNSITVEGNAMADLRLPIVSYPAVNVVRVTATPAMLSLFLGDGDTTPAQTVFEISTHRDVSMRSIDVPNNKLTLNSKIPTDYAGLLQLRALNGVVRTFTILTTTTNSQGYVVLTLDESEAITSTDISSVAMTRQTTINAGTYGLWNRVTSPEGDVPIIYAPGVSANIVVTGTIDLRINGEFPSPVEVGRGAILLRSALTYPRIVELDGTQLTVMASAYDVDADETTITVGQVLPDVTLPQQVLLRGSDGGVGFDGYAECKSLTDTLLAPLMSESLAITYTPAAAPTAFRLAQSTLRFSAPHVRTVVARLQVVLDTIRNQSNFRFTAPAFKPYIVRSPYPIYTLLLSAGPDQDVEYGDTVSLSAAFSSPTDGHTFEWEQTSGDAVVFTYTDPVTIEYLSELLAPGTRTFTFYVDRGTPNEQSFLVTVNQVVNAFAPLDGLQATFEFGDPEAVGDLVSIPVTGIATLFETGDVGATADSTTDLAGLEITSEPGDVTASDT